MDDRELRARHALHACTLMRGDSPQTWANPSAELQTSESYLRQNRFHDVGRLDTGQFRVQALVLVSKALMVDPEQV